MDRDVVVWWWFSGGCDRHWRDKREVERERERERAIQPSEVGGLEKGKEEEKKRCERGGGVRCEERRNKEGGNRSD